MENLRAVMKSWPQELCILGHDREVMVTLSTPSMCGSKSRQDVARRERKQGVGDLMQSGCGGIIMGQAEARSGFRD